LNGLTGIYICESVKKEERKNKLRECRLHVANIN